MNRLPNWLQWLLFLPLSIIASILFYSIAKSIASLSNNILLLKLFLIIAGPGFTGYLFVYVASKLAPSHNFFISLIMTSFYGIITGIILYKKDTFGPLILMSQSEIFNLVVFGAIAAVIACYQTYDDLKNFSVQTEAENKIPQEKLTTQQLAREKLKRKKVTKNQLPVLSIRSDISAENSIEEQPQKQMIISESDSEDLEWEVTKVTAILNSKDKPPKKKPVQKDNLLISAPESIEDNGGHPQLRITQAFKKEKDFSVPSVIKLKEKASESIAYERPENRVLKRKSKSKLSPKHGFLNQYPDSIKTNDQLIYDFHMENFKNENEETRTLSKHSEKSAFESSPIHTSKINKPKNVIISDQDELGLSKELEECLDISLGKKSESKIIELDASTELLSKDTQSQASQSQSEFDSALDKFEQGIIIIDDDVRSYIEKDKSIDDFLNAILSQESAQAEVSRVQDSTEPERDSQRMESGLYPEIKKPEKKRWTKGDQRIHSTELSSEREKENAITQIQEEDVTFSYLKLNDLERQVRQTTTELNFLIRVHRRNELSKFIENVYRLIGEDDTAALINTEIFYLWCMASTVFEFSIDSDFRKKLIIFFDRKVVNLYLERKKYNNLDDKKLDTHDSKNFSYYSDQVRINKVYLNSSFLNSQAEILFGKIVFKKLFENIGDQKVNIDEEAILLPVQTYYELKQRVVEILNDSTDLICYG